MQGNNVYQLQRIEKANDHTSRGEHLVLNSALLVTRIVRIVKRFQTSLALSESIFATSNDLNCLKCEDIIADYILGESDICPSECLFCHNLLAYYQIRIQIPFEQNVSQKRASLTPSDASIYCDGISRHNQAHGDSVSVIIEENQRLVMRHYNYNG